LKELKLISSLFDQEVKHTLSFLDSLKDEDWNTLSQPWDSFLFHGHSRNLRLKEILVHMAMLEHYVIDAISKQETGSVLTTEGDETLCEHGDNQDLIACYQSTHEENLKKLSGLRANDLDKQLTFLGQRYTGIGLLWMLTGHHAFHLGQLRSMNFHTSA